MGNNISNPTNVDETETCLICWENIDSKKWSKCIKCNIVMHNSCEENYRGERGYCKCPHCQRAGTIGGFYSR
jgi:hypothetical protein